jgi:hypothetical protein
MQSTFKWSEEKFDLIFSICTSLTNYHCLLHPLRAKDLEYYSLILNKYREIGEEKVLKRA